VNFEALKILKQLYFRSRSKDFFMDGKLKLLYQHYQLTLGKRNVDSFSTNYLYFLNEELFQFLDSKLTYSGMCFYYKSVHCSYGVCYLNLVQRLMKALWKNPLTYFKNLIVTEPRCVSKTLMYYKIMHYLIKLTVIQATNKWRERTTNSIEKCRDT